MRTLAILIAMAAVAVAQKPVAKPIPAKATKPAASPIASPAAPKIDKAKLEPYFRHLFVWPPPIEVSISDPTPAPMAGFWLIKVTGRQGAGQLTENFYISQDQQHIIRGQVFDSSANPFKPELDKLNTQFQPAVGTAGAPVVLVEFSDFECQFCKEEASILRTNLLKDYPKDVRLYFVNFPLEQIHPWAKGAAMMSRCVFHQSADAFWDYHDWIFEHQADITPDNFRAKALEWGKAKGLDADQLGKCFDTKATEGEVNQSIEQAKSLEVQSTPTTFINGRRLAGAMAWPELKRVIDFEIDYQKTAKNAGENCGCDLRLPTIGFAPAGSAPALPDAPGSKKK